MNSSSIPTSETPFQNNNDGCVQTSVVLDLTESSLDCKPSAAERGIADDFDSYSLKDTVFNESENAIVAIGNEKNITNPKLDRFTMNNNQELFYPLPHWDLIALDSIPCVLIRL